MFSGSSSSLLTGDIPNGSYEEQMKGRKEEPVSTYVPFRNGLFLSIASCVAMSRGCEAVVCGIHKDDAAGNAYPDCSIEFYNKMNKAVQEGTNGAVKLIAPFVDKTKADIVAEGLRLDVPYEMTWSCYKGGEKPCGKCGTCIDRIEAFRRNGAEDPLKYEV